MTAAPGWADVPNAGVRCGVPVPEAFNRFGLASACHITRGGASVRRHTWAALVCVY